MPVVTNESGDKENNKEYLGVDVNNSYFLLASTNTQLMKYTKTLNGSECYTNTKKIKKKKTRHINKL